MLARMNLDMKDDKIIITNSSNGIDYGELKNFKKGNVLIKEIEEHNLKNLLFFELRDFIVDEEMNGYIKVTFEVPYKVLEKKIRKIKMTRNNI